MTVTLAHHRYAALSPSLFQHTAYPVAIGFDGINWRIAIRNAWDAACFASRDEAAATIASAILFAFN